jgi:hypothetical protein
LTVTGGEVEAVAAVAPPKTSASAMADIISGLCTVLRPPSPRSCPFHPISTSQRRVALSWPRCTRTSSGTCTSRACPPKPLPGRISCRPGTCRRCSKRRGCRCLRSSAAGGSSAAGAISSTRCSQTSHSPHRSAMGVLGCPALLPVVPGSFRGVAAGLPQGPHGSPEGHMRRGPADAVNDGWGVRREHGPPSAASEDDGDHLLLRVGQDAAPAQLASDAARLHASPWQRRSIAPSR